MFGEKCCLQEYYPNDSEIIFRYMSFKKFMDLITTRSLYLARGDMFEDTYEGIETLLSRKIRELVHDNSSFEKNTRLYERNRRCVAISCWYVGDVESYVMRANYAAGSDGIAIRTSVRNLKAAIAFYGNEVCVRKIEYVENHDKKLTKFGCPFYPFSIKKRRKFKQENELRVIWGEGNACKTGSLLYKAPEIQDKYVRINVDPSVLIEHVIVSSSSSDSFYDEVQKKLHNLKIETKVIRSELNVNNLNAGISTSYPGLSPAGWDRG